MGYEYAIEQCCETLLKLSSEKSFEDRMVDAFSEIEVIEPADISKNQFIQIQELNKKFFSITKDNFQEEADKEKVLRNLAAELVHLCIAIIKKRT